ncbi:MAG: hypothetical protein ACUVUG_05790 [Candidatus Aminicenantia bacterium]
MIGYFHFAKKVLLDYRSFPHFMFGFSYIKLTYRQLYTYEYFSMPETPLLTPFIIIYFLMDYIRAERISLALHLIIGVLGIFTLGKHLKLSKIGIILWNILFFLSDNLISQYNSGHINWKTICFFPWVFYFYIKSYENKKFIFLSVLFNLLIIFEGGIHIFIWSNLFIGLYGLFVFIESRRILDLLIPLGFYLSSFLLGSIKIVPMLHFFGGYKPPQITSDPRGGVAPPYSLKDFFTALTTPNWGAEYANYIGILVLILFAISILFGLKRNRPVLFTSLFFTLLTLQFNGVSLFHLVRKFPILNSQRIPPRFFVVAIFGFGLLSALFVTYLNERLKKSKRALYIFQIFLILLTFYIYLDLNRASSSWQRDCPSLGYPDQPIFFNYSPKLHPEGKCIQEVSFPNYRAWKLKLKENSYAIFEWLDWNAYRNVIKFGIYRNGRFENIKPQSLNGILSVLIPKDARILTMKYDSPYFKTGFLISVFSMILGSFLYLRR